MKKSVYQHCTNCQVYAKHNIKTQQLKNEHFSSPPQPMEFIAMDLIGEFHPTSSKGNRFALTAVCMLTRFTFCIPLKTKRAENMIKAYIDHICCMFGPLRKILTDNGSEFKNKLWTEVFKKLRIEQKFTHLFPPVQWQNRRIPQVPQSHDSKTTRNLCGMGRPSMESHSSIQFFPHRILRNSTIFPDVRTQSSSKTHTTRVRKP